MKPVIRKILDMNAYTPGSIPLGSNSLLARRLGNLGASSVLFYQEPVEMVSGRGAWMVAADGTRYLDFYNNVPSVGHCHPRVVEAIASQAARLNIHTRYLNGVVDGYLESLKSTLPGHLDNILMTCTGSEANDLALRIAMKCTGNRGFIVTETAYHGNTLAVTEVSPAALKQTPLPDYVVAVPAPALCAYGEDIATGLSNAVTEAIKTLESRGYGFAGLICDSIFSSDGVHSDPPGFLGATVTVVKDSGGLYIADEVQPGFGRTGTHMWGFQRHGVIPDLVTMGKPMGNGFPVACVAARSDNVRLFCEDVGYFNTFGGNPVAAAAGQAVLDIIADENLCENARTMGDYLIEKLNGLRADWPIIGDVRGSGLFIGVDLCQAEAQSIPAPQTAVAVINRLKERQVLIGAAGKFGNTLKLRPPLCLSKGEADFFLAALEETIKDEQLR